jgi:hypothetical protein
MVAGFAVDVAVQVTWAAAAGTITAALRVRLRRWEVFMVQISFQGLWTKLLLADLLNPGALG